ncbi:putative ABC transporter permease protein [Actinoplanes missouriensis 431]|uniref:Putative ABC transporter permease protein n=1 Tax=Actinoplanes missouriensis (strain ATCC 14538 / DSM 43046 / CBS 188.64 / JCM 3121 / NBRC 102363 / NCIMB 12654 / NRRL B-3342 / UNCC 431) TaxID=512565 RepID=I0HCH4_ACTM4|nr:ABC transporter permease [Actinoplanes missouriensis]BAL90711.1 putative ABC transporter permease protein [Actinoplanes missouriensis 431]
MRRVLPPVIVGVLALVLWELVVTLGRIAPFILPAPSAIWRELVTQRTNVWEAALASGTNALVGLVCGSLLAILAALLTSRSRILGEISVPFAAVINALPIIALAPILNNMFESTSSVPRRLVTAIVVFFPVFLNLLRGLREVNPVHQELMRTYAASGWTFARKVRLPGALPHLFTGLRQASSLAVIAAVVAEYFGGLQDGLGARITSAAAFTAYPRAWAFVAGACLLGLTFYLATLLLERLAMPWRQQLIS